MLAIWTLTFRIHECVCERFQEWFETVKGEFIAWLQRCTPLRLIVTIVMLGTVSVWAVAFQIIEKTANTPEHAGVESPRTLWSCKGRAGQMSRWHDFQQVLASEASRYEEASPYDNRARLVLLGDSIFEAFRGTSYGEPSANAEGVPAVLQDIRD